MNWQQAVSLGIVSVTAAVFLWRRLRPRKFNFERDTHCGCAAGRNHSPPPRVIYRARKGERPQVILK